MALTSGQPAQSQVSQSTPKAWKFIGQREHKQPRDTFWAACATKQGIA
jgi:hypothetical protein